MNYWPFWLGGVLLAAVALGHWVLLQRLLAVSGRVSALIDRMRYGAHDEPELSNEEIMAALREATAAEFGADALGEASPGAAPAEKLLSSGPVPLPLHFIFFGSLILGGVIAGNMAGSYAPAWGLKGQLFSGFFGGFGAPGIVVLLVGGILVGIGTRMAGGCTTGHGLCGMGRMEPGSIVATCSFFGAGVVTAILLGVLL